MAMDVASSTSSAFNSPSKQCPKILKTGCIQAATYLHQSRFDQLGIWKDLPVIAIEIRDANCDGLPVAGLGLGRVDGEKYGPNSESRRGRLVGLWRGGGFGGGRRLATIRMVAHTSYAFNG
ncbi:N-acetylmannosamine kinase [Striga asiatica]|uniref:N-acetylmannosamine kinase n=1 Tax=Striga asiatica TaxID=4170 RepID=A0A5A7QI09_STRAF|nr:N-acetylmannosamine kinase [Striga asiatica]